MDRLSEDAGFEYRRDKNFPALPHWFTWNDAYSVECFTGGRKMGQASGSNHVKKWTGNWLSKAAFDFRTVDEQKKR